MTTSITQPSILSFTEMATSLSEIHQAHAHILKTGHFHHTFAASKLITFAAKNPDPLTLSYTHSIFTRIQNPNPYTYNTIIRAYANSPTPQNALPIFLHMLNDDVSPDNYTFTFTLKACAGFGGLEEGKQIHGHLLKIGSGCDLFIQNTLICLYARTGCLETARDMFDKMPQRDVVSWNALLSGYVEMGMMELASALFGEMEEKSVESWNFMISGYVNVGLVEEARRVFDMMPLKNVVSWNAMINGYAQVGCFEEVLVLFEEMQNAKVEPDDCTLVNVLSACACIGALSQGDRIHAYIVKSGIGVDGFIATALVDMYSKCGNIEKAEELVRTMPIKEAPVVWESLLVSCKNHGNVELAECVARKLLDLNSQDSAGYVQSSMNVSAGR